MCQCAINNNDILTLLLEEEDGENVIFLYKYV